MKSLADRAWSWLRRELDRWSEAGLEARFWWRDDDAAAATPELSRLLALCRSSGAPLALAVIPAACEDSLAELVQSVPNVVALQHGYAHRNHALPGELKLELGGARETAQILDDLALGFDRLRSVFGNRFHPVMVPPWNRIDSEVLVGLGRIGLRGLSTYRVRRQPLAAPGLLQVNTHLDPVHWRHRGGFIGVYPAIAILIQDLIAKRSGYRDIGEPTGILSHHLAYDEATWRFTEALLAFLSDHPAARWTDAGEIWPSG